jgi:hypothetical protein
MDMSLKQQFIDKWQTYFGDTELPLVFYYTQQEVPKKSDTGHHCLIAELQRVRQGKIQAFTVETLQCNGAKRYLGFTQKIRSNFNHFLSYGIPGVVVGERYKKSPEIVDQVMQHQPPFTAPGSAIVFKRWDLLEASDQPIAVIFFARPDVLSGLFTLANYDVRDLDGVITPFCAGCASIVYFPYHESLKETPRAVLGVFDVSARPYVKADELTISVPMKRFQHMVENMDESFLSTESWATLHKRITHQQTKK